MYNRRNFMCVISLQEPSFPAELWVCRGPGLILFPCWGDQQVKPRRSITVFPPNLLSFLVFLFSSHLFFCYLSIFLNRRGTFCYLDVFVHIRTPEVTWVNFQGLGVAFVRALWKFLCIYCCLRITSMYIRCFGQASPSLNFFLYSPPHYFNLPTSCA